MGSKAYAALIVEGKPLSRTMVERHRPARAVLVLERLDDGEEGLCVCALPSSAGSGFGDLIWSCLRLADWASWLKAIVRSLVRDEDSCGSPLGFCWGCSVLECTPRWSRFGLPWSRLVEEEALWCRGRMVTHLTPIKALQQWRPEGGRSRSLSPTRQYGRWRATPRRNESLRCGDGCAGEM